MHIKKGDTVSVIKGKDRGKTGKVASVDSTNNKVVVQGLNMLKKSVRPKKQGEKGQIVSVAAPLNASNVMFVCPSCGKSARTGQRLEGDVKKRYCKKCKSAL